MKRVIAASVVALSLSASSALAQEGDPILFDLPGFPSSADPRAVALGDLDSNGFIDLVFADLSLDGLQVRLQRGLGFFSGPVSYAAGVAFEDVELGDVNGDGSLDIVAVESGAASTLHVWIGDGTGGATEVATAVLPGLAQALRLADVDGDAALDVLVVQSDLGQLAVFLGVGDGTLGALSSYPCAVGAIDLDLGDVDGDTILDVVTANGFMGSIAVLRGNGAGGFLAPTLRPALSPAEARLGDVDGDGDLDVVAVSISFDSLVVLKNSAGSFGAFVAYTIIAPGLCLELDDWNGDVVLDAIVGYGANPSNSTGVAISVLVGDGAGAFALFTSFPDASPSEDTSDLAIADLDADGIRDVIASLPDRDTTLVHFADGLGGIRDAVSATVGVEPRQMRISDMNGDLLLDLVTANNGDDNNMFRSLSVNLGDGSGGFAPPLHLTVKAQDLELGDFTNDGALDVAYDGTTAASTQICLALGAGDGNLAFSDCLNTGSTVTAFAVGDADQDGNLDVLSVSQATASLLVFLGDGQGTLNQGSLPMPLGGTLKSIATADLDQDGDVDAVVVDSALPGLVVLLNDGRGDFSARTDLAVVGITGFSEVLVADMNRDSLLDLVSSGTNAFFVVHGLGGGVFDAPTSHLLRGTGDLTVADVNRDGWPDALGLGTILAVALADGTGGFESPFDYGTVNFTRDLQAEDLDGDGWSEVLQLTSTNGTVRIFGNLAPSSARVNVRNGSGANPLCFTSSTAPVIGETWSGFVDTSAFPSATLTAVLVYDLGLAGLPTAFGELLVAVEPLGVLLAASLLPVVGGGASHSFPIPLSLDLVGFFATAQSAVVGGGVSLCNALDLVVGDTSL